VIDYLGNDAEREKLRVLRRDCWLMVEGRAIWEDFANRGAGIVLCVVTALRGFESRFLGPNDDSAFKHEISLS